MVLTHHDLSWGCGGEVEGCKLGDTQTPSGPSSKPSPPRALLQSSSPPDLFLRAALLATPVGGVIGQGGIVV